MTKQLSRVAVALGALLFLLSACAGTASPGFGRWDFRHAKVGTVQVNLGALTLDSNTFATGTPSSGSILGATGASTITASGLPAGLTINGPARTWAWDGTGSVSTGSLTLTETLVGYANSPRANSVGYSIIAPIVFDTSIGASVDADGFASLPLRAGGHRYFVNSATGNDANGCTAAQSASTPLATIAAAFACIPDNSGTGGNGDQILLAEGSTFNENLPWLAFKGGFSAAFPTVIQSYDPADPTNTAKYGRGDQRNARPLVNVGASTGNGGGPFSYLVVKGIHFASTVVPSPLAINLNGNNVTGGGNYLLLENDQFDNTGFSYTAGGDGTTAAISSHLILRNDAFQGMWSDDGSHVGCVYVQDQQSLTVEDSTFYHCGWRIGGSRDDNPLSAAHGGSGVGGGPDVFKHPLYIQANTNSIVRRNLFADGAADGGIARGRAIDWEYNVAIRSPCGTGLGAGNSADYQAQPNGSITEAKYNLSVAGINLTTIGGAPDQRGCGYTLGNQAPGSRIHNNLLIYSQVETTSGNAHTYSTTGDVFSFGNQAYEEVEFNKSFHWNLSGATINQAGPLIHSAFDNNIWDDPTSGTNTNASSAVFPNPYTESGLYAAAGVTDYATLTSLAFAHPENHYQRTILSVAFAGYGMATAPTDTTAPNLSLPTATATSGTAATIGVTTDEGNGRLYYELLTTATPPNVSQVKMGLDGSGNAGTSPGSVAISSSGAKTINLSGLSSGTYFAHFVHEDAAGNKSTDAVSSSFTLSAAVVWNGSTDTPASSADWLRSNGNLTASRTSTAAGFWAMLRASSAQTNGTIVIKVDAIGGGSFSAIGLDTGCETQYPGHDLSGCSISYLSGGTIQQGGGSLVTGLDAYTTGDCIEITKAGVNVSFFKQTACTGSFVAEGGTIDTSNPANGFGTVLAGNAYPSASNGNGTGTQLTIADASAW